MAVAENNFGVQDIIGDIAVFYGLGTAGIGTVHSAEGGIFAAGRGWREKQAGGSQRRFELAVSIPGLAFKKALVGIDVYQAVHVAGEIDNDTGTDGRAAKPAAGAPGVNR